MANKTDSASGECSCRRAKQLSIRYLISNNTFVIVYRSDFFDNDKSYSKATKEKKLKEILLEYSK